jgi:predicted PurR-regulated permease PerM
MQTKSIERNFFFGLLIATLVFIFFIFKPFWIVFVLGVSFSIILSPIYNGLKNRKVPDWLASLLTLIFFLIVLCGPLFLIGTIVFNQSQNIYQTVTQGGDTGPFLTTVSDKINDFLPHGVTFSAKDKFAELITIIFNNTEKIFSTTLATIFSFFLILLSMFYFLKDGAKWKKGLIVLSPLADTDDQKILSRLERSIKGVIMGSLFVSSIQGILLGIGFTLFGIPNAALWGVVAFFVSFVPVVGTALVWVPAVIFLFLSGSTALAIGLLIWATVEVILADNLLSPLVLGRRADIPPLLMLFSVLGGVALFGPVGLLVGPLAVSLLYALVDIYRNANLE